ncbi:MAG: metallophosphoesterase [Myxococcota bacterium]
MAPLDPTPGAGLARRPLKLVHTSDVHIHSEAHGASRSFSSRELIAFSHIIDELETQQAELFLIAGDLFDSSRVAHAVIDYVLAELARAPCPVVLIPGNHDCHDDDSIYRRFDFRQAGSHVHPVLAEQGETLEFHELDATVWGRAMVDHDHENRPLADIPPRRGNYWHIGVAHGHLVPDRSVLRSSLITSEEIGASGFDYLALGHVHVFREVSESATTAVYSGSPAPPHLPEGDWGSLAVVSLDAESGVTVLHEKLDPGT